MTYGIHGWRHASAHAPGPSRPGQAVLVAMALALLTAVPLACRPLPARTIEPVAAPDSSTPMVGRTGTGATPASTTQYVPDASDGRVASGPLLLDASAAGPHSRDWWRRYGPFIVPVVIVIFALVMLSGA